METAERGGEFEDFSWTDKIQLSLDNLILLHVVMDIKNILGSWITYCVGITIAMVAPCSRDVLAGSCNLTGNLYSVGVDTLLYSVSNVIVIPV